MALAHTLRAVVNGLPTLLFGGRATVRAGEARLASRRLRAKDADRMLLASAAFADGAPLPERYTRVLPGEAQPPPLEWSGVPEGTGSLVLLVEDPDSPTPQPFVHWLAVLSPSLRALPSQGDEGVQHGRNTAMRTGWLGCAPPRGDDPHTYHFQLFALDCTVDLGPRPGRGAVLDAMFGHVIGFGELIGGSQR